MSTPQAETQLVYLPELKETTYQLLLGQHWDKPNLRAFAAAVGAATQILEDCTFTVLVDTGLDVSTGVNLDNWGEIVGEDRGPLNDREYRRFVRARILANRSGGTTEEMLTIGRLLGDSRIAICTDIPPAAFQLDIYRESFMSLEASRKAGRVLRTAKPAAVAMAAVEAIDPTSSWGNAIWGESLWGRAIL